MRPATVHCVNNALAANGIATYSPIQTGPFRSGPFAQPRTGPDPVSAPRRRTRTEARAIARENGLPVANALSLGLLLLSLLALAGLRLIGP